MYFKMKILIIYFYLYIVIIMIIMSSTDAQLFDPVESPSVDAKNKIWSIFNKHRKRFDKKGALKRTRKEVVENNINCSGWIKDNTKAKEDFVTRCINGPYPPKPQSKECRAAKLSKIMDEFAESGDIVKAGESIANLTIFSSVEIKEIEHQMNMVAMSSM